MSQPDFPEYSKLQRGDSKRGQKEEGGNETVSTPLDKESECPEFLTVNVSEVANTEMQLTREVWIVRFQGCLGVPVIGCEEVAEQGL